MNVSFIPCAEPSNKANWDGQKKLLIEEGCALPKNHLFSNKHIHIGIVDPSTPQLIGEV